MPPKDIFVNTGSSPAPVVPPQPGVSTPAPATPPVPKKKFPKVLIFVGIGLAVLIAAILIITLLKRNAKPSNQITWWGLWEDAPVVAPLISTYESSHPGVKVNYVKQSHQDYRERLTSALAKGTGPDIFAFHNSWVPMFRNDLDSMPVGIMNPADYAKTFYKISSSDLSNGSALVGIPLEYDALVLYINQDMFAKAGLGAPRTWDDVNSVAKTLTIKNEQNQILQSGMALGRTENVDHWPEILALMMIQNNVNLASPTGKNAEGAITFFTSFAASNGVWNETLPSSTQAFAAGKLAMFIAPSWRAFEIQQQNPGLKFITAPVPQLPKDTPSEPDITYASYWAQGVSAKSAAKAVAWDFLKFISTQDSLQKLYQNESLVRSFGEPYSRVDMADLLTDHPILGPIISQAGGARSWYLYSRTFDGPTGINTQLTNYFKDAINAIVNDRKPMDEALDTCAQGVRQVLSQYRLLSQ
jgi:multiple sugar transport system substrate-binding protein